MKDTAKVTLPSGSEMFNHWPEVVQLVSKGDAKGEPSPGADTSSAASPAFSPLKLCPQLPQSLFSNVLLRLNITTFLSKDQESGILTV